MAEITQDLVSTVARGSGYNYDTGVNMVAASGICDLRSEVGEVKETVKDAECSIRHDIGTTRETVKDAECSIRHDILKAEGDLKERIVHVAKDIENRVSDLERNVDTMFCKTNENIKDQGSLNRETTLKEAYGTREKVQELSRWRDDKEESRFLRTWDRQERLEDKIEKEGEKTRTQLHSFEKEVADRFCKENERELQSKIDELRAKVACCECPPTSPAEVADTVISRLIALNVLGTQGLVRN